MIDATTYRDKLRRFFPPFVVENEIYFALLLAVANRFFEIYEAMIGLKDADWSGPGLLLTAKENLINYNDKRLCLTAPDGLILLLPDGSTQLTIRMEDLLIASLTAVALSDGTPLLLPDGKTYLSTEEILSEEEPLREKLRERLQYWSERGTEKGIKRDLEKMFGLRFSNIYFHGKDEGGIIGDVTAFDDVQFVDANKLIEFHTSDRGYIVHRPEDDEKIKKYIIPIDAEIIFIGE